MMRRFVFPGVVGLALILTAGIVHGLWTDRWQLSDEPAASAARLAEVPSSLGDWDSRDFTLDARSREIAGVSGYVFRQYVNRKTGMAAMVLLVCGRPGPISVHTPDVCFRAQGFVAATDPQREILAGAEFWNTKFSRQESLSSPQKVRAYWAWNADGRWQAPEYPRLTFARQRALFKLYVTRELAVSEPSAAEDPIAEFTRLLIPALDRSLFPSLAKK